MKTVISRDQALSHLDPHLSAIRQCILDGWAAWATFEQASPDLRRPLSLSCRARFVFDHITYRVRRRFADVAGVRVIDMRGFPALLIQEQLLVRFKKLMPNLRTRGIPTQQQLSFEYQLELAGIPTSTKLIAGYLLNPLQTEIDTVWITCPLGPAIAWKHQLYEPPAGTLIPYPTPQEGPPQTPHIRPKEVGEQPGESGKPE